MKGSGDASSGAEGLQGKKKIKWLSTSGWCQSAAPNPLSEPCRVLQPSAKRGSLATALPAPRCTLRGRAVSRRLRFTPSKQTDMCFARRRHTEVLRLLAPAASHRPGSLKNDTAFFISTKKKNKQLGVSSSFLSVISPSLCKFSLRF